MRLQNRFVHLSGPECDALYEQYGGSLSAVLPTSIDLLYLFATVCGPHVSERTTAPESFRD